MYLIAGLGNPTLQYEGTRHNAGFEVIDKLSALYDIPMTEYRGRGILGKGMIGGVKVILLKPLTYMNLSGECVREVASYYRIDPEEEMMVIFDDVSLDPGEIRVRRKGSAGGHNGIRSIIDQLDTSEFDRIRVGIGKKPREYELADYVLGHFNDEEKEQMIKGYDKAADAVLKCLTEGIDTAMNAYNRKAKPKEAEADEGSDGAVIGSCGV